MDYQSAEIAAIYDRINPRAEDTDFYVSLAGTRRCAVLDLGCGTGTLCCALAERGHQVTGVDPAAAMLAVAKKKPFADQVEWVECSAQVYHSERRFDLIVMTGHAFQCLLTDTDASAAFATMRRHLTHRGRIAFETRNPQLDWAGEWGKRSPVIHDFFGSELSESLKVTANEGGFVSFKTSYRVHHRLVTTNSTLRFASQKQVEDLLSRSGLALREILGDWDARPFEPARSREMIFIAESKPIHLDRP